MRLYEEQWRKEKVARSCSTKREMFTPTAAALLDKAKNIVYCFITVHCQIVNHSSYDNQEEVVCNQSNQLE